MKNFVTVLGILLIQITLSAQIPTEDLILHLPFNGNALDESGNLNNGEVNGANLTTDRFGNEYAAYSFDGIDDYILINNNNLNPTANVTFSFWFSPSDDLTFQSNHQIFFQSDVGGDNVGDFIIGFNRTNCWSFPSTDDGKVNFELQGDLENNNTENCSTYGLTKVSSTTDTWDSNEWYHITVVLDNGSMKFYLNATLENTHETTSALFTENQDIILGRYFSPQHLSVFNGKLDDVLVYNRAFNQEEIKAIYEGVTSVDNTAQQDHVIRIFPVPTSNHLVIDIKHSISGDKMVILNTSGQIVLETVLNQTRNKIKLGQAIPEGIYFVQVYDANNVLVASKKIMKQ